MVVSVHKGLSIKFRKIEEDNSKIFASPVRVNLSGLKHNRLKTTLFPTR